ncbi:MAG: type IV secretory system conjugative DNA transfer family protein [Bacilli bacterium]
MKLKFRATAKDYLIFAIFAVVLLYLVAIGVLNLSSLASGDVKLHGFNPFPAFTGEYLAATIVAYIVILVFIMTSVSSYFFDREKGFGVTTDGKKEKGYSRWSDVKEMKKTLKQVKTKAENSLYAGIPIINDGENLWVDDGESHSLIIGSTGSGKTQTMVLPLVESLAKHGESMIVTDPKGEIYEKTANMLRKKGYNVVVLNFRDPQKGNSWNPLSLPYNLYKEGNKDKANELLDDLAMNILYDEKSQSQDPFWEKTSADYFTGLSLGLFDDALPEEINLNSINLMTTVGEEKLGNTTYIKEYFGYKDPSSPAYVNASSTIMAPSDTKSSILSVFKQKIKLFSSRENLSEMLATSDFDMKDIGRTKTAVFIVIQDEKKTYHSLVTIFIKQCYETLIDVAQEAGGKLPFRTNFVLDEFANMPPLKDVTTMITAARSRNIRFNLIIQNFAQLYQVYGKENGETIKGNCGNIVYLISSEIGALEEISKMCGESKSKEKDKTASTPLITVSDLQRLKEGEIVILRTRMWPFKTKVIYDWKIDWGYKREIAPYPNRQRNLVCLFNLKTFVDNKRENKISEMMNNFNSTPNVFNRSIKPQIDAKEFSQVQPVATEKPVFEKKDDSFNIDDLVKRIDAKIAELEEQEKIEEQAKLQNNFVEPIVINEIVSNSDVNEQSTFEPSMAIKDNKIVSDITDDQFFDDFFNDD